MILANGCNITKSETFKGVWILSVPTVYIYIYWLHSIYKCFCYIYIYIYIYIYKYITINKVTHTLNLCSAFNPPKVHTHTAVNTHTVNTNQGQGAALYAARPGGLGVRCLAQGSHLSLGIEGGESAVHSLPPPTTPACSRLELTNFWLQVRLSNH